MPPRSQDALDRHVGGVAHLVAAVSSLAELVYGLLGDSEAQPETDTEREHADTEKGEDGDGQDGGHQSAPQSEWASSQSR